MTMRTTTTSAVKKLPGIGRVLRTERFRRYRHSVVLTLQKRRNYVFTQFLRVPSQYDALSGPVADLLVGDGEARSLRVSVWGCSNGAEPYSIASVLLRERPDLELTVRAFDIDESMLAKARSGSYTHAEVFRNATLDPGFVEATFSRQGDSYRVKPAIRRHVSVESGNLLDADLVERTERSDVVFVQNLLYHLKPTEAKQAFEHICRMMKPRAALFVDGMDPGLKVRLTEAYDLEPLDYRIAEIHDEARRERGSAWPYEYWGLEPFSTSRKNWKRRYATIFLSDGPGTLRT